MLSWMEIDTRAVAFAARWRDCNGDERQYGQTFEKDFMQVFGVDWLDGLHEYQLRLQDGLIAYVDYLLPGKILIEMKSRGKSLAAAYSQAMSYVHALRPEEVPALLMVSDFDQIHVYSLKKDHPYKPFRVRQLRNHSRIFSLLAGYGPQEEEPTEIEVNTSASYKMARIHDALRENGYAGHELEVFLVRLLFCLFADDTGIFEKDSFQKYIESSNEDGNDLSGRLNNLFWVLNTPEANRMKTLSDELRRFRYINGNIFRDSLPPAAFDRKMRETLIAVSREFDWTQISPSIFGAMFQGVMDQEARRALGAHYTSQENILKVIRPLFLDELYNEFERSKATTRELKAFQDHLASLTFLDPACGSGNFLIVTYQELRRLEFEVLKLLHEGHQMAWVDALVKVKPGQFYGIELEDFPCQVAQLSMVLMKHLMDREVGDYFGVNIIDFPIRENANIVRGNALRIDWNEVVPKSELSYIMGNPPFVGQAMRSKAQAQDIQLVFSPSPNGGKLDYVAGWFKKAADFILHTNIEVAFVSSNSICQGESVNLLWEMLLGSGIVINFAYTTFKWTSEAKGKAAVMCVIVGFSMLNRAKKLLYTEEQYRTVEHINGYLNPAPDVFIRNRSKSINSDLAKVVQGSPPADDGRLLLSAKEKDELLIKYPELLKVVNPFMGSREFINDVGYSRYCLWFAGISPSKFVHIPELKERFSYIREYRLSSPVDRIQKTADIPFLFTQNRQPDTNYLFIPRVSSSSRKYVPVGFLPPDVIASDSAVLVYNAGLYEFGIICSNVHNAWMRIIAGRLKNDYRYAPSVYYNFPFPEVDEKQRVMIEAAAQAILDARRLYPDNCLADMYGNEMYAFPELLKAHQQNDRNVWEAYGRAWPIGDESACVAHLMKLYQEAMKIS